MEIGVMCSTVLPFMAAASVISMHMALLPQPGLAPTRISCPGHSPFSVASSRGNPVSIRPSFFPLMLLMASLMASDMVFSRPPRRDRIFCRHIAATAA